MENSTTAAWWPAGTGADRISGAVQGNSRPVGRRGGRRRLESGSVGLEDRDALRVLRDAFEPEDPGSKYQQRARRTGSTPTGSPSTSRYATCFRPKWTASEPLSPTRCTGCTASWSSSARRSRWPFLPSSAGITASTVCCQAITTRCVARCIRRCATTWDRGLDRRRRRRGRSVAQPDHRGDERRRRRRRGTRLVGRHGRRAHSGVARSRGGSAASRPPDALSPRPVRQRPRSAVPAPMAISQPTPFRPTRTAVSSFTSAWSPAAWSAPPSSTKPGPATGGGYPVRMAPCGSTATAGTC